jgi:hypothetical protein
LNQLLSKEPNIPGVIACLQKCKMLEKVCLSVRAITGICSCREPYRAVKWAGNVTQAL